MRRPSPLALRLLAVHSLVLFLPVAGIWSLAEYERALLAAEESGMISQARALAAGLGAHAGVDGTTAGALLRRLERPLGGRVRVVSATGEVLADTALPGFAGEAASSPVRDSWLYRLGSGIVGAWRRIGGLGERPAAAAPAPREPEIAAALAGKYGSATRPNDDGSLLVLSSAVPIRSADGVVGAVVVSRSTVGVLVALDGVRVDLFRVVLLSLVASTLLAVLLARSLVRPLARLSEAAESARRDGDRGAAGFPGLERRDEIGDLARALTRMRAALDARVDELEGFAAEVAHELRNPLSAVRASGELLAEIEEPEQRRRLSRIIESEVARMQDVVSGLHELAQLDAEREEPAIRTSELRSLAETVAEGARVRSGGRVDVRVRGLGDRVPVPVPPERAARVLENLLSNAVDFSPPEGTVEVIVAREGRHAALEVLDAGPGIPAQHRERIFEKFFSHRPGEAGPRHLGLGLNIVRSIVERYGGRVEADDRVPRGARLRVVWPLAPGEEPPP